MNKRRAAAFSSNKTDRKSNENNETLNTVTASHPHKPIVSYLHALDTPIVRSIDPFKTETEYVSIINQ